MQRFLTAAAVVSTMALATSGLALAQGTTTSPSGAMNPSTSAPATTTPGMTPSTGAAGPSAQSGVTDMNAEQSPQAIRQAQEQLKSQGLYNGHVDGKMGPETAQAISKFQQQNGLPQSSQLDQQTLAKLGGNSGMSTSGSGSSTPPASMRPSTGAGGSVGTGGASAPSGTTPAPSTTK